MALEHVIEQLRSSLADNAAAEDVFRNFSKRGRAWDSVAARSLWDALKKDGKQHPMGVVADVLGAMAEAGIGKPKTKKLDMKGPRVVKLTNIQYDLRKIGTAMVASYQNVGRYQAAQKERNIEGTAEVVKLSPSEFKVHAFRTHGTLSISITINGRPIIMPLPDLPPDVLTVLIERLKRLDDSFDPKRK